MHNRKQGIQISVGADLLGNLVGAVVDLDHRPVSGAQVVVRLLPRDLDRGLSVEADQDGAFTADMEALSSGAQPTHVQITAAAADARGSVVVPISDLSLYLTHVPADPARTLSLDGEWRFQPDPPDGFCEVTTDDRAWKTIEVPSHWAMKGFEARTWTGGYRRWVHIPAAWKGLRLVMRFDGVHTGCEAWVNGRRAGYHDGGAVPFEFDVTDLAIAGEANLFSVRVTEDSPSSYLNAMSMYAHFPLGGIYRNARLLALPPVHVSRLQADAEPDASYKDGVLRVSVTVANQSGKHVGSVPLKLTLSRVGEKRRVAESGLTLDLAPWSRCERLIEIPVKSPRTWDLEHPNLYELQASVTAPGGESSTAVRRVGFRKVEIRDSQFLLNGVPVRLKGANRHDSHPLMGRAITRDVARRDLELMQGCNMNSFRTSHYPPIEGVIELASEMGFGVEEEAALCFVGIPWGPRPGYYPDVGWVNDINPAKDPWYIPILVQQAAAMIERDRSQPSVLWWSLSNESDWGPATEWMRRWVKAADSTRPVSGSGGSEIAIYHNPTVMQHITESKQFGKPALGEEALAIFQGFGENNAQLHLDPGMRDLWVAPFIPIWKEIQRSPWYMGCFTWAWSDDCFLVPGYGIEQGRYDHARLEFELAPYETADRGIAGEPPWGVVDGWRRPRPEWWLHKKLFSPVKIEEKALDIPEPGAPLRVAVENRFDFTNLSEIECRWRLGNASGRCECDVPPRSSGSISIPLPAGATASGQVLELEFAGRHGAIIDAFRLPVGSIPPTVKPEHVLAPPEIREERTNLGGYLTRVVGDWFELAFAHSNGRLCRGTAGGRQAVIEWPVLHVLPNTDAFGPLPDPRTWQLKSIDFSQEHEAVAVSIQGAYHQFDGGFVIRIDGSGLVRTDYKFTYSGPEIGAREVGLRMTLPAWCNTIEWTRNAEWSVYPEDHIGRPAGRTNAFPVTQRTVPPKCSWSQDYDPLGCNDFRSAKRGITMSGLFDSAGAGVLVESDGAQTSRACVGRSGVDFHVLDYYGGTRSSMIPVVWEPNYGSGRALKAGDILEGTVRFRMTPGGNR